MTPRVEHFFRAVLKSAIAVILLVAGAARDRAQASGRDAASPVPGVRGIGGGSPPRALPRSGKLGIGVALHAQEIGRDEPEHVHHPPVARERQDEPRVFQMLPPVEQRIDPA